MERFQVPAKFSLKLSFIFSLSEILAEISSFSEILAEISSSSEILAEISSFSEILAEILLVQRTLPLNLKRVETMAFRV
jgi:hypothetical protein